MTELGHEESTPVTDRPGGRSIRVRAMGFAFDTSIPRWWFFGNPWPTHVANGLNLLFPDGERFFIRSVKHYLPLLENDPELRERVRAFFGQEGRHGHEHERVNRILEAQGYEIQAFLALYRKLAFGWLEPNVPPHVRLAVTAALEHFTASLAENGLRTDIMDNAHPVMRDLLRWHAAEEIEHKSVAFDVLQRVDPRYSTRVLGLAIASVGLFTAWALAMQSLMAQERTRGTDVDEKRKIAKLDPRLQAERKRRGEMFQRAIGDYLRRDFHPDQNDNYELARSYLQSVGRLDG